VEEERLKITTTEKQEVIKIIEEMISIGQMVRKFRMRKKGMVLYVDNELFNSANSIKITVFDQLFHLVLWKDK